METAEELINSVGVSEWDIEKFTRTFYPTMAEQVVKPASHNSYGFKFVYIKPLSEIFAEDLVGGLKRNIQLNTGGHTNGNNKGRSTGL